MCALEFRCRFEKAMTTPSLGITIFGGAKERESDRIPLRHFPSTRIIRTVYRRGYRSDRRRGVSLVHQFKRMDRIHIGSPFPRPPSLSYFISFFVAVYLFRLYPFVLFSGSQRERGRKIIKHKRPDGCTCFPTTDKEGETSVSIRAPYRLATAAWYRRPNRAGG